jgi:dimethylhistidine N-methyltransferase
LPHRTHSEEEDRAAEADAAGERAAALVEFRRDVQRGLLQGQKQIPPKWFYDERGAALFDRICELDEYYLTRTELGIMREHAAEMAACLGPDCALIEFGSGSGAKTRLLLDRLERPLAYVPVDLSARQLEATARAVRAGYPHLRMLPVAADFSGPFALPAHLPAKARLAAYFPGSTVGNFTEPEIVAFLHRARQRCGAGSHLLIGIDLVKDTPTLELAYNDRQGVTADFNLNVLVRANRELGADFDLSAFSHLAFYDEEAARIEMHLVSQRAQTVRVGGSRFEFADGESILTEYSHKFRVESFAALALSAGYELERLWTDSRKWFAVLLLRAAT